MASKKNILIGCTGSVATIKVPLLADQLSALGYKIVLVPTSNALHFLNCEALTSGPIISNFGHGTSSGSEFSTERNVILSECCDDRTAVSKSCDNKANLQISSVKFQSNIESGSALVHSNLKIESGVQSNLENESEGNQINLRSGSARFQSDIEREVKHFYGSYSLFTDSDEWGCWAKRGDPVLHVQLRDWADLLLLAPLDANTLAKAAQGICDNLLTCVLRAWDFRKPVVFCPAMNTQMYKHPLTKKHIDVLKDFGFLEVESITKRLVCGETGIGAMAEVATIVEKVTDLLTN